MGTILAKFQANLNIPVAIMLMTARTLAMTVLASAAAVTNAWAYPSDPCPVTTTTCKTITLGGTSALTGSNLAARASFKLTDEVASAGVDTLTVTFSNISADLIRNNPDILTAVLFTLRSADLTIFDNFQSVSAVIDPGSDAVDTSGPIAVQPAGDVVGGEWGYGGAGATNFAGFESGISSSGLGGWFGQPTFPGGNLAGPNALDGSQYGIVGPGAAFGAVWNPNEPMIKDTVKFTLRFDSGGKSFDLTETGSLAAAFQYGTSQSEPRLPPTLPIPGTAALLLAGVAALGFVRGARKSTA